MKSFGRASRKDTMYVITLRSGKIERVRACKMVPIPTDSGVLVYFHSNSYNAEPVVFRVEDIITVENDGKVVDIWAMVLGCLGGGVMGGIAWRLCTNMLTCTIKNAILNKFLTVVVIGGVVYVTTTAIANTISDESMEFWDGAKYCGRTAWNMIQSVFKKKDGKEVGNEDA